MNKYSKYAILITLALVTVTALVYAQPIDIGETVQAAPFESNPTNYSNDGMNPVSTAMMYDGDLLTAGYVYTIGTTGTAWFELTPFTIPTNPQFDPGWVEIKMKYEAAATTDDEYRIQYSTDGTTWIDLQPDVSGSGAAFTAAIRPWTQLTEPIDGAWSWSDISNLRVRFYCTRQPPGPFPPGVWDDTTISIYEVWADVYPLPLPPTSSTTISVLPVGVMGVKPYDAMLYPAGPQGFCFVEIYVNDVADLYGYMFLLYFDTNLLSPTVDATTTDYFSYYPWTIEGPGEVSDAEGYVSLSFEYGWTVPVGGAFYGNSPIARIYFKVDNYGGAGGGGAYGGLIGTCDLTLDTAKTKLSDSEGVLIPATFYDGWFSGPRFMSYQGGFLPSGDPTSTMWHELYPDYCKEWHLTSWEDNPHGDPDGMLSPSDQIDMTDEAGWKYWFHVDEVTTTIHWTFKTGEGGDLTEELGAAEPYMPVDLPLLDPRGTYWHQVYGPPVPGSPEGTSGYCRWFEITSWTDTNANDLFDPSDQFDFYYFDEGVTYWAHLDDVSTDIVVSQKPIPPEQIPEFPLGIGLIMALAPIIPLIYLWRRKVWKK